MENSHVFLLPGIHDPVNKRAETQGLVLQEAQAMELPVVISDVGGMKYGIIPDETGFVVRENDITGFADAIEKFILNPQLIVEMGKKGRKFVVDKYDNKIIGAQLIEIYEKL